MRRCASASCGGKSSWAVFLPFPCPLHHERPLLSSSVATLMEAHRWSSTSSESPLPPSHDEMRKALDVLKCSQSATFGDIRKKYLDMAKVHHPDVATASTTSSTMSAINEAYDVLQRAQKTGKLPFASKPSSSGTSGTYSDAQHHPFRASSTTSSSDPYEPLWGDEIPPEVYEAMWQQMHEQGGGMHSGFYDPYDGFPGFFAGRPSNKRRHQQNRRQGSQRHHRSDATNGGDTSGGGQGNQEGRSSASDSADPSRNKSQEGSNAQSKQSSWSDEELKALRNMYQDGKSFDFIANALGKPSSEVVGEFNRWYHSQQSNHRSSARGSSNRGRGGRERGGQGLPSRGHSSNYYSGAPPFVDMEDAFYHSDAFDENGVPLDAYMYYDIDPIDMDASDFSEFHEPDEFHIPFREGQHFMHRGDQGNHHRAQRGGRGGRGGASYKGNNGHQNRGGRRNTTHQRR